MIIQIDKEFGDIILSPLWTEFFFRRFSGHNLR